VVDFPDAFVGNFKPKENSLSFRFQPVNSAVGGGHGDMAAERLAVIKFFIFRRYYVGKVVLEKREKNN